MTSVSRRTFLGTAAAASVSAVAAPAMAASTSGNNLPAKWDDTVDVVVLGCGGAGMMAACQAHDAGGKVAVYDAGQSPFHTATNLCGGLFTAWGSKMQNADPEGRKDSWQQFAEDIMAYGNYMSLKEPVYCFAKNSGKAFDFLEDAGLAKHHLEPYAVTAVCALTVRTLSRAVTTSKFWSNNSTNAASRLTTAWALPSSTMIRLLTPLSAFR